MEKVDFAYLKAKSKTNGDVFIKEKTLLTQDKALDKSDMITKKKGKKRKKKKEKRNIRRKNQVKE